MTKADPRIAKTRQALRAALVTLVCEQPFEKVTVQDIAARAGLGYATFFRHYPSREALLADIAEGLIGDLVLLVAPLMHTRDTPAAARTLTEFVEARRSVSRGLLVGAGDAMRRDITQRAIAMANGVDADTPAWLPRELGIVHGVGATLSILGWWLEHEPQRHHAEVAGLIDRLVFAPLSAR
ncbi:TetR/AcrR family transcriptional regulator [Novosphingobium sp.]|uniref:TetR/AcrR family transcriptional regulator n=1 Tax=Novosphingobium sp. TaxID=1874826 RepID=UPI003D096DE1